MKIESIIAALALGLAAPAHAAEFWCVDAPRQGGFALSSADAKPTAKQIDRFDVLQAYSGHPVLIGRTWLTACMADPRHPDTLAAFSSLIGVNPEASAAMAKSTGLVDRGVRLTRDMGMCLTQNAPAVGYSSIPLSWAKPCF